MGLAMSDSVMPSSFEVRDRVEMIPQKIEKGALKFILLAGARVSEVVGMKYSNDDTTNYGIRGRDMDLDYYVLDGTKIEVCKFNLRTAKRGGLVRVIALPIDREYEPWTEDFVDLFSKAGSDYVWYLPRQRLNEVVKVWFEGLEYPIEKYKKGDIEVSRHWKPFRLHALRHLRATELMNFYGFSLDELRQFMGWTASAIGHSAMVDRYAHLDWQRYFPKLLKRRY
jgi:integrase